MRFPNWPRAQICSCSCRLVRIFIYLLHACCLEQISVKWKLWVQVLILTRQEKGFYSVFNYMGCFWLKRCPGMGSPGCLLDLGGGTWLRSFVFLGFLSGDINRAAAFPPPFLPETPLSPTVHKFSWSWCSSSQPVLLCLRCCGVGGGGWAKAFSQTICAFVAVVTVQQGRVWASLGYKEALVILHIITVGPELISYWENTTNQNSWAKTFSLALGRTTRGGASV